MIERAHAAALRALLATPRHRYELADYRTSAIASLVWDAALRPSEAIAMNVPDLVIEIEPGMWTVRPWISLAGTETVLPYKARRACLQYLQRVVLSRWVRSCDGPFFLAREGQRLTVRSAQLAWSAMQARAQLEHAPQTFQDLRADRLERAHAIGGRAAVATVGRLASYNAITRYDR